MPSASPGSGFQAAYYEAVDAKMASLLEVVARWAYRVGYASRDAVLIDMREYTELRFVDEQTREITPGRVESPALSRSA